MRKRSHTNLIHEGEYITEIVVEILITDDEWSPYLIQEDSYKIDDVKEALLRGDVRTASTYAKVYTPLPATV